MKRDPLIIMYEDLQRAIKQNEKERRFVMVIDRRKCVGCFACTVACISENKLPVGVIYRVVYEEEKGKYPNLSLVFTPRPCMQCDNPPCVKVCPADATFKSTKGISAGIVVIDYEKCIGCQKCVEACPYGARSIDKGIFFTENTPRFQVYEKGPFFEYIKEWKKEKYNIPEGNARKCHFCMHRLNEGILPACTTTCIGRATYFGDENDKNSLVYKVLNEAPKVFKLKDELGTKPRVYYI